MPHLEYIEREGLTRLQGWGGDKLVREMIGIFLEAAPERVGQIRSGLAEGDQELATRGAHSLKSTSANLGAVRLSALSARAEEAGDAGRMEEVRNLLPELEEVFEATLAELRLLQGEYAE